MRYSGFPKLYHANGLTDDQIRRFAPAVFAEHASSKTSDRYEFVPTSEILAGLRADGFVPFMAAQARTTDPDNRGFTRHVLRLRRPDAPRIGGAVNEVILMNSHNGGSTFQLTEGWFRFVCANGLVAGDDISRTVIRHMGNDVVYAARKAADHAIERARESSRTIERMMTTILTDAQRVSLARTAAELRWGSVVEAPLPAERLLRAQRMEDTGNDLWRVFNRVQENVTHGGQNGIGSTGRRLITRGLGSVAEDYRINAGLWRAATALLPA